MISPENKPIVGWAAVLAALSVLVYLTSPYEVPTFQDVQDYIDSIPPSVQILYERLTDKAGGYAPQENVEVISLSKFEIPRINYQFLEPNGTWSETSPLYSFGEHDEHRIRLLYFCQGDPERGTANCPIELDGEQLQLYQMNGVQPLGSTNWGFTLDRFGIRLVAPDVKGMAPIQP